MFGQNNLRFSAECTYNPFATADLYNGLTDLGYDVELSTCQTPHNFRPVKNASLVGTALPYG